MVIGDPNKFAFIVDYVHMWNATGYEDFLNGLFFVCINGHMYPKYKKLLPDSTLSVDVGHMFSDVTPPNAFISVPKNQELFCMKREDAFRKMFLLTYPCVLDEDDRDLDDLNIKNNYTYLASTTNIRDNNGVVFCVSDGKSVRVLGGQVCRKVKRKDYVSYSLAKSIDECILSLEDMRNYTNQLRSYYFSIKKNSYNKIEQNPALGDEASQEALKNGVGEASRHQIKLRVL